MVHGAIRLGQNVAALAPAAVVTITLDPAQTSPLLNLSVGNLRASKTSGGGRWVSSKVTVARSGMLFYFEAINIASNDIALGVGTAAFNVDDGVSQCFFGNLGNISVGGTSGGTIVVNGAGIGLYGGFGGAGSSAGLAVNQPAGLFWLRQNPAGVWNNSGAANPATGVGGIALPAAMLGQPLFAGVSCFDSGVPDTCQINVGATAFSGAIPAGFSAYQ